MKLSLATLMAAAAALDLRCRWYESRGRLPPKYLCDAYGEIRDAMQKLRTELLEGDET